MPLTFHDFFVVEEFHPHYAVISYYWDKDFEELLPTVLGRNLNVNSVRRRAIFIFPDLRVYELWVPPTNIPRN